MAQYISKSAVVAEIERRLNYRVESLKAINNGTFWDEDQSEDEFNELLTRCAFNAAKNELFELKCFLDTLEVKEVNAWHLQEKEDIYDAVKGWSLQTFVCVMKDGSIQNFTGILDEDYEGHINVHIDGVNDDYDNVNDIVKWIELT